MPTTPLLCMATWRKLSWGSSSVHCFSIAPVSGCKATSEESMGLPRITVLPMSAWVCMPPLATSSHSWSKPKEPLGMTSISWGSCPPVCHTSIKSNVLALRTPNTPWPVNKSVSVVYSKLPCTALCPFRLLSGSCHVLATWPVRMFKRIIQSPGRRAITKYSSPCKCISPWGRVGKSTACCTVNKFGCAGSTFNTPA